ncbi:type II toxin-antitoxin system prevent-host-death family antitoxin [Micromonospora sp. NPDC005174]|uniref:type II toxin-antitoxin system prevent-host-death family antitoxin n=1 Tax=Micromonospora sp. NPDC005174 TaxID=3157018 RepID=UPI0033A087E8
MADSRGETDGTADVFTAEEARKRWAELIGRAQHAQRHSTITRSGKRAAIVVDPDWYDRAEIALAKLAADDA